MYRLLMAVMALIQKIKHSVGDMQEEIDSIGEGYKYKGSVNSVSDLPDNAELGDKYTVTGEDNAEYVWDGTSWKNLNPVITNAQIDSLYE